MTFYHTGSQPKELFCRRVVWAEGKSPVGGETGIEVTDDLELWDSWIDELPRHNASEAIERVELFSSAPIGWSHDMAPQLARVMDRRRRMLTSSEVAEKLGLSAASIQRFARDGLIPFSQTPGGHRRFNFGEVEEALAGKAQEDNK